MLHTRNGFSKGNEARQEAGESIRSQDSRRAVRERGRSHRVQGGWVSMSEAGHRRLPQPARSEAVHDKISGKFAHRSPGDGDEEE